MKQLTRQEIKEIARLYRQGWGARNIARIIGKSEDTVVDVLRGRTAKTRRILGGRIMNGKRPAAQLEVYK